MGMYTLSAGSGGGAAPVTQAQTQVEVTPERGRWGMGLGLTFLHSAYEDAQGSWVGHWSDPGTALGVSYRANPWLSAETLLSAYFDPRAERRNFLLQPSLRLHAPTGDPGLSPYLVAGVTVQQRHHVDDYWVDTTPNRYTLNGLGLGPHVGLGVEIDLAAHWYIGLDVRGVLDLYRLKDPALPVSLQTGAAISRRF